MNRQVQLRERTQRWVLYVERDRVVLARDGVPDPSGGTKALITFPRCELGTRVTPLRGALINMVRVHDGQKHRVFEPCDQEDWTALAWLLAEQRSAVAFGLLKVRAGMSTGLASVAVPQLTLAWDAFLAPVAVLTIVGWAAVYLFRRGSILLALGILFTFGGILEAASVHVWGAPGWRPWVLPALLCITGIGHWRAYTWLRQLEEPSHRETALAALAGVIALAGIGIWAHLAGYAEVFLLILQSQP